MKNILFTFNCFQEVAGQFCKHNTHKNRIAPKILLTCANCVNQFIYVNLHSPKKQS